METNNTIQKFCKERNITENQFFGKEKIGGYLYLRSLTSIPEGFNPTVGGDIILKNSNKRIRSQVKPIKINRNFLWNKNGKKYAKIDGIFCEIIKDKILEEKGTLIYHAKKVNKENYFYIANKNEFYAHGDDIKKAIEDLEFKIISDKLKSEPINKDTIINMRYYRLITGSCEMECKEWMDKNNTPKEIKAEDLLPLLEKTNAYGLEKFKKLITF